MVEGCGRQLIAILGEVTYREGGRVQIIFLYQLSTGSQPLGLQTLRQATVGLRRHIHNNCRDLETCLETEGGILYEVDILRTKVSRQLLINYFMNISYKNILSTVQRV